MRSNPHFQPRVELTMGNELDIARIDKDWKENPRWRGVRSG